MGESGGGVARTVAGSGRAPPCGVALSAIGSAAGVAPPGQRRFAGREPETRRAKTVAHDSGDRAAAGGAADRPAANAASLSEQTAALGLRRSGGRYPGQRRIRSGRRAHPAVQEAGAAARAESQSQSPAEGGLPGRSRHGQRTLRRLARILFPEADSREEARAGPADGGAQDGDHRPGALEERSIWRNWPGNNCAGRFRNGRWPSQAECGIITGFC